MNKNADSTLGHGAGAHPSLANILKSLPALEAGLDPGLPALTIKVLRHLTVEGLVPYLRWRAAQDGLKVQVSFGGYGTIAQDIMGGEAPNLIVLALDIEDLDPAYQTPGWMSDRVLKEVLALFDRISGQSGCTVVAHRFPMPLHPPGGILLSEDESDLPTQIHRLNAGIAAYIRKRMPQFQLLDWDCYLRQLGASEALDLRFGYQARAPFRPAFMDLWAQDICRILRALSARAKKCLVLDCDGTLWGGIVGEDGPRGIALDAHDYPGRAFRDFQRTLINLKAQGVLLALCSRNNEPDVFEVIDDHPDCLIRREHLAAWRISWGDKADSLRALAAQLNLGLDAFVFVDDNPAECARIRESLPTVRVLQVPEDLWELPDMVLREGLFDAISLSGEDRRRTEFYLEETTRKELRAQFTDLNGYLSSLSMIANIRSLGSADLARAAQLTQKTNQFNLTIRRFNESELAQLAEGTSSAVVGLNLTDRFGSLGMVGVLVAQWEGEVGRVINLLLSCRALGRRAEEAFVAQALRELEVHWGIRRWEAEYFPSQKNTQAREFWDRMGFRLLEDSDGHRTYLLEDSANLVDIPSCITIQENLRGTRSD